MISVAITGSYCSGKSTVMSILRGEGYKTFSCDEYVSELYQRPGVIKKINLALPAAKNTKGGIAKDKLFDIFLTEPKSRAKIESIIHPLVRERILNLKEGWREGERVTFFEVPLLFETGLDKWFDVVMCCYCTEKERENRAKKRGAGDQRWQRFFHLAGSLQMKQAEKKERADILIDTSDNVANIDETLSAEIFKIVK